jgi:hypothetical protein
MTDQKVYKEQCKERFKKIVGKKFETVTVYPLSQFETIFGHLWGHGKPKESLTDEENVMRAKWEQCRTNILNVGNQQRRNFEAELSMYDVLWNRYQTVFYPVRNEQE